MVNDILNACKIVEMGIEGDGNDALLRQFGNNIDTVYPVWLVKDGDDFTYPRRRGIEVEPAEWTPGMRSSGERNVEND